MTTQANDAPRKPRFAEGLNPARGEAADHFFDTWPAIGKTWPVKKTYAPTKLQGLELSVFRQWRSLASCEWNPKGREELRVLLLVSGGADSMALARVMVGLKTRLKLKIEVLTIHHGAPKNSSDAGQCQGKFRDQAEALVVREVAKLDPDIPVHCVRVPLASPRSSADSSEAGMRRARWELIQRHVQDFGEYEWLVFGHHEDDLLETRLIRLLRGTGLQGLEAMRCLSVLGGIPVWRPFLTVSAAQVRDYLATSGWMEGKNWQEDPSNQDKTFLRNRIRHELIPLIEAVRKGGVRSLKRSLGTIVSEGLPETRPETQPETFVDRFSADESSGALPIMLRADLMNLSPPKRRQAMSHWLREQRVRDYSQAHIDEALKRLDTRQKRLKFELCGRVWIVDSQIRLVAPSQSTRRRAKKSELQA